ncbi:hypothetical protein TPAR_01264 [Tolypocladium paradoxum]|uniref:Uncharacterized protein n=1 Tax=Tolypocladium paradoxum TaxID=94208 RepID=A0A2S4L7W5_9HYPO|nr:hypothetical protein TPAR_01264 [Tolypocladium paradoxum]
MLVTTAPTITLNLVSCVFTTPPSSSSERARAHPKNRQVPSQTIRSHLQSSPTWCCTRFAPAHARGTRPDAPASPHSHIFQSLRLSLPLRSQAWVLPRPRHHPHAAAAPLRGRELDPDSCLTRFDDVYASIPTPPTLPAPPQPPSIVNAVTRPWPLRFPGARFPCSVPRQLPSQPRARATTRFCSSLHHLDMRCT